MSPSDPNSSSPNDEPLPPLDPELLDLERRLGALLPAAPRSGWSDATIGQRRRGSASNAEIGVEGVGQRGWLKFAPLGIAAVVMITGGLLASRLDRTSTGKEKEFVETPQAAVAETQLVTVSLENMLRETEPEDVVEVEGYGLMRPVTLHFETAQCWIDSETETSVQVIHPWQELVFYPVNTY